MRAESNFLSRRLSLSNHLSLTSNQLQQNHILHSFAEQASDPYTLAAVFAGGVAFRGVRGLGLSTLSATSPTASVLLRAGVTGGALVAEAGTFVTSERLLKVAVGGADQSLLRWEGANGLKNAWASATVNFTALRGAGRATMGMNGWVQHFAAAGTMVGANQVTGRLGLTDAPSGNLFEQFVHASVMDLQMRTGMGLFHHLMPGVASWERSMDLVHEVRSNSLASHEGQQNLNVRGFELLSMASEASGTPAKVVSQRAIKAQERAQRMLEEFRTGVEGDHRLTAESKEAILRALGEENGLDRAKQMRDDILSTTVPDKAQLKFLEMKHLVPNGVSLLAGVLGISSMFAAHEGSLSKAAWLLVGAAVADKMDGFIARKMKATHPIGAMLDSFVDVSCYGMASGFFVYSALSRIGYSEFAPWVASVIGINAILRLATFDYLDTPAGKTILPPRDILRNPVQANGKGFIGKPSTMTGPELAALWMAFGAEHPSIFLVGSALSGIAMYAPLAYAKLTDSGLGTAFRSKSFLGLSAAAIGGSIYEGNPRILSAYALLGMGYYLFSPFITAAQRVWRNRRNSPGGSSPLQVIGGDGIGMPDSLTARPESPSIPPGTGIGE